MKNITKIYGEKKAVNNITFDIPENSIYGLVGVNGAGKTTIMRMLVGLTEPTDGDICILDRIINKSNYTHNKEVGYLPDVPQFYNYMTAIEYLNLCGEISGMNNIKSKSYDVLEKVGLEISKKKIGNYSLGMKQRLGLAQALLNSPKILICDEPTSALDPLGRKEMLDLLSSLKSSTTILFSTHILADIERICDDIAIIDKGNLLFNGTIKSLNNNYNSNTLAITFNSLEEQENFIKNNDLLSKIQFKTKELSINIKHEDLLYIQKEIFNLSINSNIFPNKIEVIKPSLENILIEVTK